MKMYKSHQVTCLAVVVSLAIMIPQYARSQNYQVGVPVCDTIILGSEFGVCTPHDVLLFGLGSSLIPYVTGLSFQIVITEANGRIWSDFSDTLKVGDVLPIPGEVDSGIKIFFANNSSFKFMARIVGIPSVPDENYYCEIKYSHTTMVCGNTFGLYGAGSICQVQPATSVEEKDRASILDQFQLLQNYPNPFNPETTISYTIPQRNFVQLKIFDKLGQEIRTLVWGFQEAGPKAIKWDGKNDQGRPAPSGIYIYQLTAGAFGKSNKALLLK